jgi:hypothetical protein
VSSTRRRKGQGQFLVDDQQGRRHGALDHTTNCQHWDMAAVWGQTVCRATSPHRGPPSAGRPGAHGSGAWCHRQPISGLFTCLLLLVAANRWQGYRLIQPKVSIFCHFIQNQASLLVGIWERNPRKFTSCRWNFFAVWSESTSGQYKTNYRMRIFNKPAHEFVLYHGPHKSFASAGQSR